MAEKKPATILTTSVASPRSPPAPGRELSRYTVNLSTAPEHRYDHIIPEFAHAFNNTSLTQLFVDLVHEIASPRIANLFHKLARLVLRRVHSDDETAELRGISAASGVPMYLLVVFNVLLDLLLGCTSGGVRLDGPALNGTSGAVHFRTLDWDMEPLRQLVVQLDFIPGTGKAAVATTVGYLGYVGVLTGVRPGLSMSLNFRPRHDGSGWKKEAAFRWHQLLVILGFRPSISSTLRRYLLGGSQAERLVREKRKTKERGEAAEKSGGNHTPPLAVEEILSELETSKSTSAYLIFCTPQQVYSVEKDNCSASTSGNADFLATCNHDLADEQNLGKLRAAASEMVEVGMREIVEESTERKKRARKVWERRLARRRKAAGRAKAVEGVDLEDVVRMVGDRWITNCQTHYAVIMDPGVGKVVWGRAYQEGDIGD